MDNLKEFYGLSIRAMTALGVFCLEKYSKKYKIDDYNLTIFSNKMLELLTAENIIEWNSECNKINITGLGDQLPEELIKKHPQYKDTIDQITQSIREISASQIYGEWDSKLSYSLLNKIQKLCQIQIDTEFDLELFKIHKTRGDGWGTTVSKELIEKWIINCSVISQT